MTHSGGKPHNVGDKGQRFEVRAYGNTGKKTMGWSNVGWTETIEVAEAMAAAMRRAPSVVCTEIFDRTENRKVITQYVGILR